MKAYVCVDFTPPLCPSCGNLMPKVHAAEIRDGMQPFACINSGCAELDKVYFVEISTVELHP